jgi:hypothetical protein
MRKSSHLKKINKRSPVIKGRKIAIAKNISVIKDDLTKNILENAARKSMGKAAEETMKVMGYNVVARNGWVVKIFPNNKVERISRIPRVIEKR